MSILRPNMGLATELDSNSGFSNSMQFKLALQKLYMKEFLYQLNWR
jgi:hypothetical protein